MLNEFRDSCSSNLPHTNKTQFTIGINSLQVDIQSSVVYHCKYYQGRPLGGAAGVVAPGPALSLPGTRTDRGPCLTPGPASAKDGPEYYHCKCFSTIFSVTEV